MDNIQKQKINWERRPHKKWVNDIFLGYYKYTDGKSIKDSSKYWDIKHILPFLTYLEENNIKNINVECVYVLIFKLLSPTISKLF